MPEHRPTEAVHRELERTPPPAHHALAACLATSHKHTFSPTFPTPMPIHPHHPPPSKHSRRTSTGPEQLHGSTSGTTSPSPETMWVARWVGAPWSSSSNCRPWMLSKIFGRCLRCEGKGERRCTGRVPGRRLLGHVAGAGAGVSLHNSGWAGAVGEDVQQVCHRHKIEPGTSQPLGLQVVLRQRTGASVLGPSCPGIRCMAEPGPQLRACPGQHSPVLHRPAGSSQARAGRARVRTWTALPQSSNCSSMCSNASCRPGTQQTPTTRVVDWAWRCRACNGRMVHRESGLAGIALAASHALQPAHSNTARTGPARHLERAGLSPWFSRATAKIFQERAGHWSQPSPLQLEPSHAASP